MRENTIWTIEVAQNAPKKPKEGEPCNGCGVCCAAILCPSARVRFLKQNGPCAFLQWNENQRRYACALISRPFLIFPQKLRRVLWIFPKKFRRFFYRKLRAFFISTLAISKGCDSSIWELE